MASLRVALVIAFAMESLESYRGYMGMENIIVAIIFGMAGVCTTALGRLLLALCTHSLSSCLSLRYPS